MQTVESARLRLVPVTVQNANVLWSVLQQPDLRRFQDLPTVGAAAFLQTVARRPKVLREGAYGRFEWLIYVRRFRRPAGWVSLRTNDREGATGEIGYSILREFRKQGVAREAVALLLQQAFDVAGLQSVRAYCVPENVASRRVLERAGFEFERTLRRGATVSGEPVDVLSHILPRERWSQSGKTTEISASA